jgi:hypothetical protein
MSGAQQYEKHIDVGVQMALHNPHAAKRLGEELSMIEATLRKVAGDNAYEAFRNLCVFHKDVLPGLEAPVIQVLEALAKEFGLIESDKPNQHVSANGARLSTQRRRSVDSHAGRNHNCSHGNLARCENH